MKKIYLSLILLLTLVYGIDLYAGAGNRIGTGGAAQLLIPTSAKGISMGEQGVATATDVEALFWNPAGVAKSRFSSSVTFSHVNYIADIGIDYGAVATNIDGFGTVALSLKSFAVGDIPVTTTRDPDGDGTTFSPQILSAGLTYSRQLTDRISIGITGSFLTESLGDATAKGVAFDVGVIYDNLADFKGLSLGVALKNIGPSMSYDGSAMYIEADAGSLHRSPQLYKVNSAAFELPSLFQIGLGYKSRINEMNSLLVTTTFQNNNFSYDEYRLGLEYGYNDLFFVRSGYAFAPQSTSENYMYGFTAGAGVNYQVQGFAFKIDYAYRDVQYFDANHIITLTMGF